MTCYTTVICCFTFKGCEKISSLLSQFPSLSSSLFAFLSSSLFLSSELVEHISEKIVRKQIVQNQRCLVKEKAKIRIHIPQSSEKQEILTASGKLCPLRSLDSGREQPCERPETKAFQVLWSCSETGTVPWQSY